MTRPDAAAGGGAPAGGAALDSSDEAALEGDDRGEGRPVAEGGSAPAGEPEAGAGAERERPTSRESVDFKVLSVIDVSIDLPANHAVVTLVEDDPPCRRLEIPIGIPDASSLAYALRGLDTRRPLTHELFADVLRRLRADVVAVRLVGRSGGTYLAELDLMSPSGHEVVSCRPSDGLTLALRQPVSAPVLSDELLLATTEDVAPAT